MDRCGSMDLYGPSWCQGLSDPISLFDATATISSSRPNIRSLLRASGRQGWPKAIAKRLALDGREHSGRLVGSEKPALLPGLSVECVSSRDSMLAITTIPRGARHQARASRHKLVFGRSVRVGTMMQSYASAAKLRGGGPILNRGSKRHSPISGCRHLGSSSAAQHQHETDLQKLIPACPQATCQVAARSSRPAGASPVVTSRQSAMRSLRANATIMVLRAPPRASAVRLRYHSAKALSF
jgi:hypothetical protein